MLDFFTTTAGAWDDGSVRVNAIGIAVVVVIILALVIISASSNQGNSES